MFYCTTKINPINKNDKIDINYDTDFMEHEDLIDNLDDKCSIKITNFLQFIQSESKPSNTGERPNPYWCPQFGNNLLKIAKHFPL